VNTTQKRRQEYLNYEQPTVRILIFIGVHA